MWGCPFGRGRPKDVGRLGLEALRDLEGVGGLGEKLFRWKKGQVK